MLRAVVGLGANLGRRLETLRRAASELARVAHVERTSRVFSSAAVGGPVQPDFLNAAALVAYIGSALTLLDDLLAIELRLGRERREKWGPRIIDLDLLWAGGLALATPRLVVPHPHLTDRAFALAPLLELVPDARDPRTGQRYVVPAAVLAPTGDWL